MSHIFQNVTFMTLCVTEKCNATCTYCYIPAKYTHDPLQTKDMMSQKTVEQVVDSVFLNKSGEKRFITLQFHGGEPSLLGIDWYRQAIPILRNTARTNNVELKLKMQSNFIAMSDEFAQFLKENNIEVNISLDGPPEIHDKMRSGGEASVANLKRYVEITGDHPGLIAVIGQHNYDKIDLLLHYFYNELGLTSANFQWVQAIGRGRERHCLTPEGQINGAIKVINFMNETNGDFTETYTKRFVRMYFDPEFRIADRGSRACEGFYCMAWNGMVSVSSQGEVIGCDTLLGDKALRGLFIDEYYTNKDSFIAKYNAKKRCCHSKSEWWARCESCEARAICDFGCPSEYHTTDYGKEGDEKHCDFIIGVYNYIKQHEKSLSHLYHLFVSKDQEITKSQIEGAVRYVENIADNERKKRLREVIAQDLESNFSKKYRLGRLNDLLNDLHNERLEVILQNNDIILANAQDKHFVVLKKMDELYEVDELTFERMKQGEKLYKHLINE